MATKIFPVKLIHALFRLADREGAVIEKDSDRGGRWITKQIKVHGLRIRITTSHKAPKGTSYIKVFSGRRIVMNGSGTYPGGNAKLEIGKYLPGEWSEGILV